MGRSAVRIRCFAKINLGLQVLQARPDGYHEIRTVLQTIDLHDTLIAEPSRRFSLTIRTEGAAAGGEPIPPGDENLVMGAARSLRKRLRSRAAAFTLIKRIPAGAGMGGASSDAAAALLALDRLHRLGLSPLELHEAAAALGSDVPFFLYGGACLAIGRGEEVFPLPDGPEWNLVVAMPACGLSTPEVYRAWDILLTSSDKVCKVNDFAPWCLVLRGESPTLSNDLEPAATSLRPELKTLRIAIEKAGSRQVSMTGSGAAFFGVMPGKAMARRAAGALTRAGFTAMTAKTVGRAERDGMLQPPEASKRAGGAKAGKSGER